MAISNLINITYIFIFSQNYVYVLVLMKKCTFWLIAFVSFLVQSCEYESHKVYNLPVNTNISPPNIQTIELNFETDTLVMYGATSVNFKFKSDNQQIEMVKLLVDNTEIGTVYGDNGSFNIYADDLSSGGHDLELLIFTGSGSGSIADALGAESYIASKSWKLVVYYNYVQDIVSYVKDGLLHIRWNRYLASNFEEYVIKKSGGMLGSAEIARIKSNEFIDSSYVGEMANYSIIVLTSEYGIFTEGSLSCSQDIPALSFSCDTLNRYLLRWTRTKYYNAVDSVLVFQGSMYDYSASTRIESSNDLNDTVAHVTTAYFGDVKNFTIRLVPKKKNLSYDPLNFYFFESRTMGILGYPFKNPNYFAYCYPVGNDEFVFYDCDHISRYSIAAKKILEELEYAPSGCSTCSFVNAQGSNTGKYISAYVDCNRDILLARGTSLNSHTVHHLQSITGGSHPAIAVSDSAIGIIYDYNGGFNLYDFKKNQLLGLLNIKYFGNLSEPLKISADGKFMLIDIDTLRLVKFDQGMFTDIWKVTGSNKSKFFEFDPHFPDRLVLWDGNEVSVRNCSDMSRIRSFALNDDLLLDIDYVNDELLTYQPGHLYIRSFVNGTLIRDVPVSFNPSDWTQACYLIHHTIVHGRGLLYFIK